MRRLLLVLLAVALGACGSAEREARTADRAGGAWERLPDPPLSPRENAVAVSAGGSALIVGGSDAEPCPPNASCVPTRQPPLRDGAVFDPHAGTWARIADAPVGMSFASAAVVGGDVYLLTPGEPGRPGAPAAFLRYRPGDDRWTRLPLPDGAARRSIVAAGDRVVAFADSDEQGTVPDLSLRSRRPDVGGAAGRPAAADVRADDGLERAGARAVRPGARARPGRERALGRHRRRVRRRGRDVAPPARLGDPRRRRALVRARRPARPRRARERRRRRGRQLGAAVSERRRASTSSPAAGSRSPIRPRARTSSPRGSSRAGGPTTGGSRAGSSTRWPASGRRSRRSTVTTGTSAVAASTAAGRDLLAFGGARWDGGEMRGELLGEAWRWRMP